MRTAVAVLLALGLTAGLPVTSASAAPSTYQNPLTPDDTPDPDIVSSGGVYFAFTTGGSLGHIQEFRSTDLVSWQPLPWPGALATEPSWVVPGEEWAPSVSEFEGTWVMFYATLDEETDAQCVTEATAPTVAGPYVNHSPAALICDTTQAIDPDVFVDAGGQPYLVWKGDGTIWSQPLSADGRSLVAGSQPSALTQPDQDWETTVENPDLVLVDGTYYLFFSGGTWTDSTYGVGYAVCAGPLGPCGEPARGPILASAGPVVGPGGESVFQDPNGQWWMAYAAWTAGDVGYPAGSRSLRMDPLCFDNGNQGGPGTPVVPGPTTAPQPMVQSCPATSGGSYRLVASDGGVFAYGAPYYGSTAALPVPAPIVGAATDPATGGYWEVGADGSVYGFDAPAEGDLAGTPLAAPVVGMAATSNGRGYWLVASDGGVFSFGDARYAGSAAGEPLASPVVGLAPTPDGGGYWEVAADGGVFAYGDAAFYGSMGGRPLDRPVVGVAATADGLGYTMVASDGGVFCFGDAAYRGSTGGLALNAPVVGLAPDGPGGYWLVASDGGIFAFGAAPFAGSAGSLTLVRPVVAVAAASSLVRPVDDDDVEAVCAVLARAFFDDPVASHLIGGARRRPAGLRTFFDILLRREVLPFGGAYTTEDRAGAALWTPPGKPPTSGLRALGGLVPMIPYVAGRHLGRTVRGLALVDAIHPKEPHWYLATLGTEPDRQGHGVGSALLQPVLDRCDAEGVRAYLESSKDRNVPFYRRHGFEVDREVRLPGGPLLWTMWREPRPPA